MIRMMRAFYRVVVDDAATQMALFNLIGMRLVDETSAPTRFDGVRRIWSRRRTYIPGPARVLSGRLRIVVSC
jgi:hypothetical protein